MSYLYLTYVIKIYVRKRAEPKTQQWKSTLTCHGLFIRVALNLTNRTLYLQR